METTQEYKGYTIKVIQDNFPENPLTEWDNIGDISYRSGSNYCLGNKPMTGEEIDRLAKSNNFISIPVFAYVHSRATIKASENGNPFNCPWDSGQSGIVFVSKDKLKNDFGWKRITQARRKEVIEYLKGTVEVFDHYLTGNVYGYEIKETGDSSWGFFGEPEISGLLHEAKNSIDWTIDNAS